MSALEICRDVQDVPALLKTWAQTFHPHQGLGDLLGTDASGAPESRKANPDRSAFALLQGYPLTTFARFDFSTAEFTLPLIFNWKGDWSSLFDIRVFNPYAEAHAWKRADGRWDARLRAEGPNDATPETVFESVFVLWGTQRESQPEQQADPAFVCLTEERGVRVWAPREAAGGKLPLRLKAQEYLEPDDRSGIVRTVDYRLCEFAQ